VGTYTTGESKGIYAYDYDAHTGKLTSLGVAAETENPSFVTLEPHGHFLYAVNELRIRVRPAAVLARSPSIPRLASSHS